MQGLVEAATKVAAVLEINRDDIYSKVRRVQKEHKAVVNACAKVSPEMSELLAMDDDANNNGREQMNKKKELTKLIGEYNRLKLTC